MCRFLAAPRVARCLSFALRLAAHPPKHLIADDPYGVTTVANPGGANLTFVGVHKLRCVLVWSKGAPYGESPYC